MKQFTNISKLDKMGASLGLWAVLWFAIQFVILMNTSADPFLADGSFARELSSERMAWEWITFFRVMGGLVFLWFTGSLFERFHAAEGKPGRLAYVGFALGGVWSIVWLISAFLNSASLSLATTHSLPEIARVTGLLAQSILHTLTGPILFALTLTASYVGFRFEAFRSWYNYMTAIVTTLLLLLSLLQWYGSGTLGFIIMGLSLFWIALTSGVLLLEMFEQSSPASNDSR